MTNYEPTKEGASNMKMLLTNGSFALLIIVFLISCPTCKTTRQGIKPFSPPVSFEKASQKADSLMALMTLDEKLELIGGYDHMHIKGLERLNLPEVTMSDATQGLRLKWDEDGKILWGVAIDKSTSFPCPISLAATWNPELAYAYAKSIGEECRAGGVDILLGPGMNNYRISQCGRNFEYFGEDPFLAARMIENYVVGVQSTGTIATLKHFIGNSTEFMRRRSNNIVEERVLHEIDMPAFEAGINAGAMAVMTSYNLVNGEWCGQSQFVVKDLLRKQLGFKWLAMSDWRSVYDGEKVIKSGLDLEMPEALAVANAKDLLAQGKVTEADINRMVKSILRTCFAMNIFIRPENQPELKKKFPEHVQTALNAAREGIVLLKNSENILPIAKDKVEKILVTGKYVTELAKGGGSAEVKGYNWINLLDALKNELGEKLVYVENPTADQIKDADLVILSIGTFDYESWDRPFALPVEEENQILQVASANPKTIVLVNSGGGIQMTGWNDKVAAILYAWYPGQIGNVALAEIITGKTNPSGKLPITIEKKFEDSPGYPYLPRGEVLFPRTQVEEKDYPVYDVHYKEGVFVGYRWYDSKKIEPLYPFGSGLSYTTFAYDKLNITPKSMAAGEDVTITFEIKNTGKVAGAEVAQVYVNDVQASVARPNKELKGFKKVFLQPGESQTVQIILNQRAFAFWDPNTKDWLAEPGEFTIFVGSSSKDIKLSGTVMLK
jgi:beta-glucosidase